MREDESCERCRGTGVIWVDPRKLLPGFLVFAGESLPRKTDKTGGRFVEIVCPACNGEKAAASEG